MTQKFVIYSKHNCPYCERVATLFDQKGISYDKLMLEEDYSREDFLDKFGKTTFPRVMLGEELIGGTRETVQYLVNNGYV